MKGENNMTTHPKEFRAFGKVKRVYREAGPYVKTLETPSEPNGAWWKLTEHGYVGVATNDRKLADAVAAAGFYPSYVYS